MTTVPTPTQSLVLEVLAARYRLGESLWTFSANPNAVRAIRSLEAAGLVESMGGIVPNTVRASLTDAGKAAALSDTYQPPSERGWPSVEEVARHLAHQNHDWTHGYLGADPATGETHVHSIQCANWEPYTDDARAVLALFEAVPRRSEAQIKAEALREAADAMEATAMTRALVTSGSVAAGFLRSRAGWVDPTPPDARTPEVDQG